MYYQGKATLSRSRATNSTCRTIVLVIVGLPYALAVSGLPLSWHLQLAHCHQASPTHSVATASGKHGTSNAPTDQPIHQHNHQHDRDRCPVCAAVQMLSKALAEPVPLLVCLEGQPVETIRVRATQPVTSDYRSQAFPRGPPTLA